MICILIKWVISFILIGKESRCNMVKILLVINHPYYNVVHSKLNTVISMFGVKFQKRIVLLTTNRAFVSLNEPPSVVYKSFSLPLQYDYAAYVDKKYF